MNKKKERMMAAVEQQKKGLMMSAMMTKNSKTAKKTVCISESLETWFKINGVKEKETETSSCKLRAKEPEEQRVDKSVLDSISKTLQEKGIKLNKREEMKMIKKLAHWNQLQEMLENNKEMLDKFPKVNSQTQINSLSWLTNQL